METIPVDIIRKAAHGDIDAFEQIYRSYAGFVFNVTLRITGKQQDAEEVTQDVFVRVHRHLKDFEYRSSLKTWLYRIAVNAALTRYDRLKRQWQTQVELDPELAEVIPAPQAASETDRKDTAERLEYFLQKLNPDQRTCLVLREIEGLSYEEIAQTLRININTVRTRILRAREALMLNRREGGDGR
jgi:RNA polymerase sigma-70 factor (ECF subfamily)